jgi:hypothetical protein
LSGPAEGSRETLRQFAATGAGAPGEGGAPLAVAVAGVGGVGAAAVDVAWIAPPQP